MGAITWTRETRGTVASPTEVNTLDDEKNLFGSLVRDKNLQKWSDTAPAADWLKDRINEGVARVCGIAVHRMEWLTFTSEVDTALYDLPYYALGTAFLKKVYYDGANLPLDDSRSIDNEEIANLDEDSFHGSGTPARLVIEDQRSFRLVPAPDTAKTVKVRVACVPASVTSATAAIPVPAHLRGAPAQYAAMLAALVDGNVELHREWRTAFYMALNTVKVQDESPMDATDIRSPEADKWSPTMDGDDF